jgi:hypothetical protein
VATPIVVVTRQRVVELFRNPANAAGLRNAADGNASNHIVEFPTSPFLAGHAFCTASSDGNRRDNSPNGGGETRAAAAGGLASPGRWAVRPDAQCVVQV